ncbi:hypothetical protein [uncultured Georgenia sp.]|uniref:hypothetical protein n=1 Tax=uncultured Georgenia sp. TaxID=378209 RepID=UPI00260FBD54|nr:hypothetical protein [uncultured Georgenia sp.]HLV04537.1 hypothetical protein [Actinomycetaceae bacterium]
MSRTTSAQTTQSSAVAAFFDRYATALSRIDLDTLAACYHYPALAVTRLGCQVITDPEATRQFFAANGRRYHDRGIMAVRIVNLRPSYAEDGLWVGLADLENLAADGTVVGVEHNAYQLVHSDRDGWRIAVTTPLDAR